jgi:hypothetical protein
MPMTCVSTLCPKIGDPSGCAICNPAAAAALKTTYNPVPAPVFWVLPSTGDRLRGWWGRTITGVQRVVTRGRS